MCLPAVMVTMVMLQYTVYTTANIARSATISLGHNVSPKFCMVHRLYRVFELVCNLCYLIILINKASGGFSGAKIYFVL